MSFPSILVTPSSASAHAVTISQERGASGPPNSRRESAFLMRWFSKADPDRALCFFLKVMPRFANAFAVIPSEANSQTLGMFGRSGLSDTMNAPAAAAEKMAVISHVVRFPVWMAVSFGFFFRHLATEVLFPASAPPYFNAVREIRPFIPSASARPTLRTFSHSRPVLEYPPERITINPLSAHSSISEREFSRSSPIKSAMPGTVPSTRSEPKESSQLSGTILSPFIDAITSKAMEASIPRLKASSIPEAPPS